MINDFSYFHKLNLEELLCFPDYEYFLHQSHPFAKKMNLVFNQSFSIQFFNLIQFFLFDMCQRKTWTEEEDNILRKLKEQNKELKWNLISDIMRKNYGIEARNGKQCREKYHNHLDKRISKKIWSKEEDEILLLLHSQYGNRWAKIARQIQGRTDNCVKNRFYSRFRRAIRNINSLIKLFWKKMFKKLRIQMITKIIQTSQDYRLSKQNGKKHLFQSCQDFKIRIMKFSEKNINDLQQNNQIKQQLQNLLKDINQFNKVNKRRNKKKKKYINNLFDFQEQEEMQYNSMQKKKKNKPSAILFSADTSAVPNSKLPHQNTLKQIRNCTHIKQSDEYQEKKPNGNHKLIQQQPKQKKQIFQSQCLDRQVALKNSDDFEIFKEQLSYQMEDIFNAELQKSYFFQVNDPQIFLNLN